MHNWEFTGTETEEPSDKELMELEEETNRDIEPEKEVLISRYQKGHCHRNDQGNLSQSSMDFTNINGVLRSICHQENKQHGFLWKEMSSHFMVPFK